MTRALPRVTKGGARYLLILEKKLHLESGKVIYAVMIYSTQKGTI